MNPIKITNALSEQIQIFGKFGHPSVMERFIFRNGKAVKGSKCPDSIPAGVPKQCFANAVKLMESNPDLVYTEGYVYRPNMPFPIHHAWCTTTEGVVVDHTLEDPENWEYMGVEIPLEQVREALLENGVYGILDTGCGINVNWIFKRDPELQKLVEELLKAPTASSARNFGL